MGWKARFQDRVLRPALQSVRTGWSRSLKAGVDLLLPPRCVYCDQDLAEPADSILLCEECRRKLAPTSAARCRRCGGTVPVTGGDAEGCLWCRRHRLQLDATVVLGRYEGELRQAVLQMKKPTGEAMARALGGLLATRCRERLADLGFTAVVPVPMFWFHFLRRGANGPETLAECISHRMGVKVARRAVVRHRNTFPQSDLTPNERFRNVRGAFSRRSGYVLEGARILLVDDVLTTGATCSSIAGVLKRGGAAVVAAAVVTRAEGCDVQ